MTLSSKLLAQTVPVAGALAGGGLNWVFMGYYQEMARVHFTIRAIERRTWALSSEASRAGPSSSSNFARLRE